jgi:predicted Zn-dependent protease
MRAMPAIVVLLLGAGCTSDREEREWGERLAGELRAQARLLPDDDPATVWARAVLDSLLPASALFRAPTAVGGYQLHVIDADGIPNAFALPGGHLYLTTGMILVAKDCAEVAGVLAHEIGHVVERHAVEAAEAEKAGNWLSRLVFGGGDGGGAASALFNVMQGTAFNRRDESEADAVAVRVAGESGYDPSGVVRFLERAAGGGKTDFFDTHPATPERSAHVAEVIADLWPGGAPDGRECPKLAGRLETVQARLARRSRR